MPQAPRLRASGSNLTRPLGVRLPDDQRALIDYLCLAEGPDVTPSQWVREAVRQRLAREGYLPADG